MHFHLPKPLHGWRAFIGEVGIIVIGVLIALGAEQVVETIHWQSKLDAARKSIDFEINDQLDYAEEVSALGACTDPFVDALEGAILRHDRGAIAKLHDTGPPFKPRDWRSTAWQSAMSTGVADRLSREEVDQDGFMFSSLDDIDRVQDSVINEFAEATSGRVGGPADATATQMQVSAAERLRAHLKLEAVIADTLLRVSAGRFVAGWNPIERHPWQRLNRDRVRQSGAQCLANARAVGAAAGPE